MHCNTFLSAQSKNLFRLGKSAFSSLAVLVLLLSATTLRATPAATTTTLATSTSAASIPIVSLTAKVASGTVSVTPGAVRFYDGARLLGQSQIVRGGTKFTKGGAYLSVQLAPGAHSLTAVFAGTASFATSTSAAKTVTIAGGATTTKIASSGSPGAYTLTGTVTARGVAAPTGNVALVDATASNTPFLNALLGAATVSRKMASAVNYPIYNDASQDYGLPQDVAVGDWNGDGILDLAVLDYRGGLSIYVGKGDGSFQKAKPYCMTTDTPPVPCPMDNDPLTLAVGDFNNDGIADLAVGYQGEVSVLFGKGDGSFLAPVNYTTADGGGWVRATDLNRDGILDLVVSADDGMSVLMGNSNGTFVPHMDYPIAQASEQIAIGDFNKDGIPDVVATGSNGQMLAVMLGKGDGTFKAEIDTATDINTDGCGMVALDLKKTGFLSDVAYCGGSGEVDVAAGNGAGKFGAPVKLMADSTFDPFVQGLAAADIDGDGNPDLLLTWYLTDTDTGRVAVFTADGKGGFSATPSNYFVGQQPWAIVTGDFNGDGTVDIAVANENTNNMSVLVDSAWQTAVALARNVAVPGAGTQNVFAQYGGDSGYQGSSSATIALTGSGSVATPVITALSPSQASAGGAAFTLRVLGTGFASGAQVKWNGMARATTFVSATEVDAAISAADIAIAGTAQVTVTVGAATSGAAAFTINGATSNTPVLKAISPSFAVVGSPAVTVTVTGSNFVSGAAGTAIYWNAVKLATTFVSATQLTAVIPGANLATTGTAQISLQTGTAKSATSLPFTVGPATRSPLAYGSFNSDGTVAVSSGNISCAWSTNQYLCTVTGETVSLAKYIVNVTAGETATPAIAGVGSSGGQIVVKFFDTSSVAAKVPFEIVVFKP